VSRDSACHHGVIKDRTLKLSRFRWVACQIDVLENCLDYRALEIALASLPQTLDETYSRILHAIPAEKKKSAIMILQLITFSERPLRIEEAVDAIAVDTNGDPYFCPKYRMPVPQEISCYCSSLVAVVPITERSNGEDSNRTELQLAHFSVKEYLISHRLDSDIAPKFQEPIARAAIAKVCLAYLLHFSQEVPPEEIRQRFPFAYYSARYWMTNASGAKDSDNRVPEFINELFCYQEASYNICYSLHRPDQRWSDGPVNRGEKPASGLYYAAVGGLLHTVDRQLNRDAEVNAEGGYFGNALQAASFNGHEQIVRLLVEKGANVNAEGGWYGNALQAASSSDHEQIVRLLVEKGANVNAEGVEYGNALQAASYGGHEQIVRLLVEKGANVNAQGGELGNALQAASYGGHEQIVRLLVEKGANVNAQGGHFGNALQAASFNGHEQIVRLLVEKGANVNAEGGEYGNALQAASYGDHEQIVRLLVEKGANVNAQGGWYGNALQAASSSGHEQIVRLLIEKGANVNAEGGHFGNALQEASYRGHEQIVRLLIEKGANVNAEGGRFGNALQAASSSDHEQIVRLLVANGATRKHFELLSS
jgi:ankyrin repeat protein